VEGFLNGLQQLFVGTGFEDIGRGTGFETAIDILVTLHGADEHDGYSPRFRISFQVFTEFQSVHIGHVDIGQHQIEVLILDLVQPATTVFGRGYVRPKMLQFALQDSSNGAAVFQDQYFGGVHGHHLLRANLLNDGRYLEGVGPR